MKQNALLSIGLIVVLSMLTVSATITLTRGSKVFGVNAMPTPSKISKAETNEKFDGTKVVKTDAEWKKILTPEQFYILREKGTEQPYSGEHDKNKQAGTYHCAACGLAVFSSRTKFDSGTGWPSFYASAYKQNVIEHEDRSLDMVRTEVSCARCNGHLGHVFDDGPEPTGLRYCINSAALKFMPLEKRKER